MFRMSVLSASTQRSKRDSLVLSVTGMRRLCAVDVACRGCAKTAKKALLPLWDASDSACVHVQKGGR